MEATASKVLAKNGRFIVYEGSSAFYLANTETQAEVCLGDGVDWFVENGKQIFVGTQRFYTLVQRWVKKLNEEDIAEQYGV